MIGILQVENEDLNKKYLKKKSKKSRLQISENTQVDFAARNMGCEISQAESLHFAQQG